MAAKRFIVHQQLSAKIEVPSSHIEIGCKSWCLKYILNPLYNNILNTCHHNTHLITNRSWKNFLKNPFENKDLVFKNGVKNIQAVNYNGTRTVNGYRDTWCILYFLLFSFWLPAAHRYASNLSRSDGMQIEKCIWWSIVKAVSK